MKETNDFEELLNKLTEASHAPNGNNNINKSWQRIEQQIRPSASAKWYLNPVWRSIAAIFMLLLISILSYNIFYLQGNQTIYSHQEITSVLLSDGSKVILNRNSSLTFPRKFSKKERMVKLSGEGSFEVSKNKEAPFIVDLGAMAVEVLGTYFNINAYPADSIIRTTLINGSVMVKQTSGGIEKRLAPDETIDFNKRSENFTSIKQTAAEKSVAWESGKFNFDYLPLNEIASILSHAFAVQITIESSALKDFRIRAHFEKNTSLSTMLELLGNTANFNFKSNENQIRIYENMK